MEPEKIMMKKARFRSLGMAGKHHSEESKRKMSAALKGRKRSEEDKRCLSCTIFDTISITTSGFSWLLSCAHNSGSVRVTSPGVVRLFRSSLSWPCEVDVASTVMVQTGGREQLGSVGRQSTVFITLKVVVIGVGCGVGVTAASCTQVINSISFDYTKVLCYYMYDKQNISKDEIIYKY